MLINASVLQSLTRGKSEQEQIAAALPGKLAAAVEKSNRIMAEDLIRESGYMLPQSANTQEFLSHLLEEPQAKDFPREAVEELRSTLKTNETNSRPVVL